MIDRGQLADARRARARVIIERSTDQLISVLSQAAGEWANGASDCRRLNVSALHESLALAPSMIEHGLDLIFGEVTEDAMRRLIATQMHEGEELGRLREDDGNQSAYVGPEAIYHSLAGNLPGQSIPVLVCGVLARSVVVVRDSGRQPVLTQAFCEAVRAIDPLVGAMLVPVRPNTNASAVRDALSNTDSTVSLHGSDTVVDGLAKSFAGLPVTRHGSRASAVLVSGEVAPEDWASRIAHDIVMYEGLGCLTPHTVIVEADGAAAETNDTATAWIRALATALDDFQQRWPRYRQSVMLEADRRAFLERDDISTLLHGKSTTLRGANDCWCVVESDASAAFTGPGMRCITLMKSIDRSHTIRLLDEMPYPVAGLGLTMLRSDPSFSSEVTQLSDAVGASLVCEAGSMQSPPLTWEQDGGKRLGDLLDWRQLPR